MDAITDKKARRFLYLKHLYEITGGDKLKLVNRLDLGQDLGWDEALTKDVVTYLREESLIGFPTFTTANITHLGVKMVERALSQPDTSTEYFPPANVIIVVNGDLTIGGDVVGRDKTTTSQ